MPCEKDDVSSIVAYHASRLRRLDLMFNEAVQVMADYLDVHIDILSTSANGKPVADVSEERTLCVG